MFFHDDFARNVLIVRSVCWTVFSNGCYAQNLATAGHGCTPDYQVAMPAHVIFIAGRAVVALFPEGNTDLWTNRTLLAGLQSSTSFSAVVSHPLSIIPLLSRAAATVGHQDSRNSIEVSFPSGPLGDPTMNVPLFC
jgi:hypothetical protein